MKWNKALKQIEAALNEGKQVEIKCHRKWNRNSNEVRWLTVEDVCSYEWKGQICKAVNTNYDQLNEGAYIIEEINVF